MSGLRRETAASSCAAESQSHRLESQSCGAEPQSRRSESQPCGDGAPSVLAELPARLAREIGQTACSYRDFYGRLTEIRLRAGRAASLTFDGINLPLHTVLEDGELEELLRRFCRGSVYAHSESLREGYLTLKNGVRVGVAGKTVTEDGQVRGIGEITSLCLRLPHRVEGIADEALAVWNTLAPGEGMLVYSLPGVGKTTLLRDMIARLAGGRNPKRVAVVDCRGELDGGLLPRGALVDVIDGCPKAAGIERAVRTLSPEVVVCDEIGGYEEAGAILSVQACGVPLIASAHGDSAMHLLARPAIALLHRAGIFGAYVGIARQPDGCRRYTTDRADALTAPPPQIL